MAKLVSLLISARRQRLIALVMGLAIFALLLSATSFLALGELRRFMAAESQAALAPFARIRTDLDETFGAIAAEVTATPCTADFLTQLRRVGFRPDGFSEFFYAPGGTVRCSLSVAGRQKPLALGTPDIAPSAVSNSSIWVDRGLSFAGLKGLVGSIVLRGDFAIVVPPQKPLISMPPWLQYEVVLTGNDDRYWHRAGEVQVFDGYKISQGPRAPTIPTTVRSLACDGFQRYCVATEVIPAAFAMAARTYILAALLFLALASAGLAVWGKAAIVRRWSFEQRFRRHLDASSVLCVYQPIIAVGTGEVVGCEVLARWRDVDDSIVYPDRFIPVVERFGLTEKFTRLVVERAFAELSASIPTDRRLKLTVNIFPRDLDSELLVDIFKVFDPIRDRVDIVVELVESDEIAVDVAQRQIEALRAAGIKTYIDDFGTGYSNIHNLAALAVDGVKLDRAFAMAPEGSLMARMLGHAIDMIHASGRAIVIEGVETAERLEDLRRVVPPIDFAQGYHISRPLDIGRFTDFLAAEEPRRLRLDLAA
ncbi:MAG: EAL domain-containing protein [Rhizobiaceae bacterium]|nr:EAL domain-containing protein [Rhizobiaceae bacterium]